MKCQAAVLRGVGKHWEICDIELDPQSYAGISPEFYSHRFN